MRLVICDGFQYDADRLPPHVDAAKCVPAAEWYAQQRKPTQSAPKPKRRRG